LRHVPDSWPAPADVSFFWFCVRIHERLTLSIRDKNNWNRGKLKDHGEKRYGQN
jgi:hypothetical protein